MMISTYDFGHAWILLATAANTIAALLIIRKMVDDPSVTLGWKAYWAGLLIYFPVIGILAWLFSAHGPRSKRAK